MRFTRQQMIHKALSVLRELHIRAMSQPIQPDMGARLALAYLWAVRRSGDRSPYDTFWRALSAANDNAFSEGIGRIWRCNELHRAFMAIIRDVGAPETPEYLTSLGTTRGKKRC